VSGRDKKLREFARSNDVMLFVAGRESSNGKVLFEICRQENPKTHFIEKPAEVRHEWFEGAAAVGISGATSTPQWLMESIRSSVEKMFPSSNSQT
jgi:4-hydroxy-3-methylbut-2-enyl diphosphate reductase